MEECAICYKERDEFRRKPVEDKTDGKWFHKSCLLDEVIGTLDGPDDPDDFDRVGENAPQMRCS